VSFPLLCHHRTFSHQLSFIDTSTILVLANSPPPYANWGQSDLKRYLQDHNVPNPENLNLDQTRELVKRHYDNAAAGGQYYFDSAASQWSDSDLRQFLLEKGVISPSTKREELLLLAREYGIDATKSVSSAWAASTDAASNVGDAIVDNASSVFYAVADAPSNTYDYVADTLQGESELWLSFGESRKERY